ncbi:MAG: BACON domain-containing protein [Rikenellaceae bacterium]|nr:BACON domain-containing protein [Rikenellaceae bacterium]
MKKSLLLLVTILFVFASCSEKDKEMEGDNTPLTIYNVPDGGMVLSSDVGSSASFIITSSQSWSISKKDGDSWFSVYPMSGEAGTTTVTITIDEANPHYDDRSSNITVGNYTITITQKKLNALILSPYKQQVASEGEILEITMMHI